MLVSGKMSAIEVAQQLWMRAFNLVPACAWWPIRDRAGGCMIPIRIRVGVAILCVTKTPVKKRIRPTRLIHVGVDLTATEVAFDWTPI
jgi:hypothetical protein